jgi:hypothetical protein
VINWQDIEERVDIYGQEAAAVGVEASERAEFIDELSVLINLGVRLDPTVTNTFESNN